MSQPARKPAKTKKTLPTGPDEARQPLSSLPTGSPDTPSVVQPGDRAQIKHFVTQLKSAEHQIGEHIIQALQDDETVAVLTTVVTGGEGGQHIVSAGLSPELLEQVQELLLEAEAERDEEVPCVGFHCLLKKKDHHDHDDDAPS